MTCTRARDVDLAAYLVEPDAPEWREFRTHFPGCADCSAQLEAWTALEVGLRERPAVSAVHPEPAQLVAFEAAPRSLPAERWQSIDQHLRGCRACADELAALRSTDFEAIRASAPLSTTDALRALGRSLSARVRDVAEQLTGRVREAAEWAVPGAEPAVQFQSAAQGAEPEPLGVLVAIAGRLTGRAYPVTQGESRVGRAPECEVRLEDVELARVEARIHAGRDRIEIESANRRAPVRVNGRPVERGELSDGDVVELGGEQLQFRSVRLRGAG
jgi:hypothetical protein